MFFKSQAINYNPFYESIKTMHNIFVGQVRIGQTTGMVRVTIKAMVNFPPI